MAELVHSCYISIGIFGYPADAPVISSSKCPAPWGSTEKSYYIFSWILWLIRYDTMRPRHLPQRRVVMSLVQRNKFWLACDVNVAWPTQVRRFFN